MDDKSGIEANQTKVLTGGRRRVPSASLRPPVC